MHIILATEKRNLNSTYFSRFTHCDLSIFRETKSPTRGHMNYRRCTHTYTLKASAGQHSSQVNFYREICVCSFDLRPLINLGIAQATSVCTLNSLLCCNIDDDRLYLKRKLNFIERAKNFALFFTTVNLTVVYIFSYSKQVNRMLNNLYE